MDKKVTPGFEALVSQGLEDFTGEKIVIDFAEEFPVEVVESASIKLKNVLEEIENEKLSD